MRARFGRASAPRRACASRAPGRPAPRSVRAAICALVPDVRFEIRPSRDFFARDRPSNDSQAPLRHRVTAGTVASFRTWRGSRPSLAQDPAISGGQSRKLLQRAFLCAPYYSITAAFMQPQIANFFVPARPDMSMFLIRAFAVAWDLRGCYHNCHGISR